MTWWWSLGAHRAARAAPPAGLVDLGELSLWDAYFRSLTSGKPGYREFWKDNRAAFGAELMAHVDALHAPAEEAASASSSAGSPFAT
jgi:hypothetical protein